MAHSTFRLFGSGTVAIALIVGVSDPGYAAAGAEGATTATAAWAPRPHAGHSPWGAGTPTPMSSSWSDEALLSPTDDPAGAQYGYAVAIDADTAVIGAYGDDALGSNSGSAYVWRWSGSGWSQQAKLLALDGAAGDYFGYAVAIGGDTAVVGAYQDGDNGADSGSAYVFVRDNQGKVGQNGGAYAYYGTLETSPVGDPCTSPSDCQSSQCVDSLCCDSSSAGGSGGDARPPGELQGWSACALADAPPWRSARWAWLAIAWAASLATRRLSRPRGGGQRPCSPNSKRQVRA